MRAAALALLLASGAAAQDAPQLQAAAASLEHPPAAGGPDTAARCEGLFFAVWLLNHELPRLAERSLTEPAPGGASPFGWVEGEDVRRWRTFEELDRRRVAEFTQAYLDGFGGLRWTVANLPLYQRDKAACLSLIAAEP